MLSILPDSNSSGIEPGPIQQRVICLAHRGCNVIFAMLRNGTYYEPPINVPGAVDLAA